MLYVIVYTIAETSKKSNNMEKQNNVSGQAFAFPDVFFTRELNVDNEINEPMLVSLKREINFLNSVNNDSITIFIGSLGGYFDPAKEMFEMLGADQRSFVDKSCGYKLAGSCLYFLRSVSMTLTISANSSSL